MSSKNYFSITQVRCKYFFLWNKHRREVKPSLTTVSVAVGPLLSSRVCHSRPFWGLHAHVGTRDRESACDYSSQIRAEPDRLAARSSQEPSAGQVDRATCHPVPPSFVERIWLNPERKLTFLAGVSGGRWAPLQTTGRGRKQQGRRGRSETLQTLCWTSEVAFPGCVSSIERPGEGARVCRPRRGQACGQGGGRRG